MPQSRATLIARLDLAKFINNLTSHFAREKDFVFVGDRAFFATILQELDSSNVTLKPPPSLKPLDTPLMHLSKRGVLGLEDIFAFVQIIRYFLYLKSQNIESTPHLGAWLEKINVPNNIIELDSIFDEKSAIKSGVSAEIDSLNLSIKHNKKAIDSQMAKILESSALNAYLVDKSVHYINQNECLLLRAGHAHVLKGMVLERSSGGFFYVMPDSIMRLKDKESALQDSLEAHLYNLCKAFSATLGKNLAFLKFINTAFDTFDHIYARLSFARHLNLNFIYEMAKDSSVILKDFKHPALKEPKPLDISFLGGVLMITGVNAGGKTMLLKSLLSACFLAKYLIPMQINVKHSKLAHFKHIIAIISDPQNASNDISTFAGRMLELSEVLNNKNMPHQHILLGIDEIELGTDSAEAASLYKVILEHCLENHIKVILTTHHKHLAALMANKREVQLCAAMYDIEAQMPLYTFLEGSIGKSYAFESALKYGIPKHIVESAKLSYGADKERLNDLIERSSELELNLKQKQESLDSSIYDYQKKLEQLEAQKEQHIKDFNALKSQLELSFSQATQVLKDAIKADSKEAHKALNKAHSIIKDTHKLAPKAESKPLKVGDRVIYQGAVGQILSIKNSQCEIRLDSGFKLKTTLSALKISLTPKLKPKAPKIKLESSQSVNVSCDLHGLRGEEAIEKLDVFLSNALIAGYDEVIIYHGIGSGILSKLVQGFLSTHPKVVSFSDAPANMGGYGAKVVRL